MIIQCFTTVLIQSFYVHMTSAYMEKWLTLSLEEMGGIHSGLQTVQVFIWFRRNGRYLVCFLIFDPVSVCFQEKPVNYSREFRSLLEASFPLESRRTLRTQGL